MRRLLVVTLSFAACASIVLAAGSSSSSTANPPAVKTASYVASGSSADVGAALVYVGDVERVGALVKARADSDAFWSWIGETASFLATLAPPPPPPPAPTPVFDAPVPSTGYSEPQRSSSGGHSDAWWHGVANCEQGGRNDPYFGYFSFMDGSMGGQPWDVQVAAGNAVLARSGSESPAWAPSCVAAGYAASPGG